MYFCNTNYVGPTDRITAWPTDRHQTVCTFSSSCAISESFLPGRFTNIWIANHHALHHCHMHAQHTQTLTLTLNCVHSAQCKSYVCSSMYIFSRISVHKHTTPSTFSLLIQNTRSCARYACGVPVAHLLHLRSIFWATHRSWSPRLLL